HTAKRITENVALLYVERRKKCHRVLGHSGYRVRHRATGTADPRVVEENHFALACELVGYGRVPIVQRSRKMLEQQQRPCAGFSETAVRIALAFAVNELRRCGDVARALLRRHDVRFPTLDTFPTGGIRIRLTSQFQRRISTSNTHALYRLAI